MNHSTLNWTGYFSYDELDFEHVDEFVVKYELFVMDNEPEYDVFDFNMCHVQSTTDFVSVCDTFAISLDMNPYLTPLSMLFLVLTSLYL